MTSAYTKRQLQIIQAAVDLIAVGGISALTMKRIAAEIKVTEPAIYRHFRSKKDILQGVVKLIKQNGQVPEKTDKKGWNLVEINTTESVAVFKKGNIII